jgi:hypothetical protein
MNSTKMSYATTVVNGYCAMRPKDRHPLTPNSSLHTNAEVRAKLGANIGFDNPLSFNISQNY